MYPNLYTKLVGKITSGIVNAKDKGNTIPYNARIGLSIFLGQPLDSTMTPSGILSAQPQPSQGPAQSPQSGVAKGYQADALKKLPSQYETPGQARQQRMQKQ